MIRLASRITMLGIVVFAISACVTTTATRLGQGRVRPAISPESVVIYLRAADVPGKYEQVALLNSTGNVDYTNEKQMYDSMRKKAAELGANGVILDATNEPGTGAKLAQALFGVSANRKGKAVAIFVFRHDTLSARP